MLSDFFPVGKNSACLEEFIPVGKKFPPGEWERILLAWEEFFLVRKNSPWPRILPGQGSISRSIILDAEEPEMLKRHWANRFPNVFLAQCDRESIKPRVH